MRGIKVVGAHFRGVLEERWGGMVCFRKRDGGVTTLWLYDHAFLRLHLRFF